MKETILQANREGRTALIPFITAGFPSPERFWDSLLEIDRAGADIIELGIPFSDPVADGPVIEATSREALAHGVSLRWVLEGLKSYRDQIRAKLVLMGYTNPFVHYGLERLAAECRALRISGLVVPDLPLEETPEFRRALDAEGLTLVTLVGPNTTEERMQQYAPYTKDYVYLVSVLGTTGDVNRHPEAVAEMLRRARRVFDVPLALGFGLREPGQLEALPQDARPDAAVFGTALIRHIEAGKPVSEFFEPWLRSRH